MLFFTFGFLYFFRSEKITTEFFLIAYLLQIALLIPLKGSAGLVRRLTVKGGMNLLITKGSATGSLVKALKKEYGGRLTVVPYESDGLRQYVEEADNIYLTGSVTSEFRNQLLSFCTLKDKKICIVPEIFEIAVRNSAVSFVGDTPVFTLECLSLTEAQRFTKRSMDIVLSVLGIAVSLPIILLVAAWINWEDNGPVFYRQEREGLNGKLFEVIKFRSMVVDAEKETGAVLAAENDRRITRIGHFIRSARIDEIPQFFNVLAGSMCGEKA